MTDRSGAMLGLAAIGAALAGCATRGGTVAYDPAGFVAPDPVKPPTPAQEYRLGVGDVVGVRVYKVDSLSGDQTIDGTGGIALPLIGRVQAAGRTSGELGRDLQATLGAKYLQSPQVMVTIKSVVQKTATVDGSVLQPGVYPVQPNTTLIQMIAMARGTSEDANPRRVVIFRQVGGRRMAAAFDLVSIRRNAARDPAVYAEDVVVVDGSRSSKTFKTILSALPFAAIFRPF